MIKKQSNKRISPLLIAIAAIIVYAALSYAVVYYLERNGEYPVGADVSYHIHRGELVYNALKEGKLWPNLDFRWYNGVEILRYWSPLCAFVMAGCDALCGGDGIQGYLLFCGLLCFFSCIPWLYIGNRLKRPILGAVLGMLWFFAPHNLYVLFLEGNLPRALTMVFLPVLIFLCNSYIEEPCRKDFAGITTIFILILLCHIGYGGMVAIGIILFLITNAISRRSLAGCIDVFIAMLLGFAIIGIYLVPSIIGGIANVDSSETMQNFFQPLLLTLNPLARISRLSNDYIGLALFVLSIFAILFGRKRSKGLAAAALIICLLTAKSMYTVLSRMPGGQYLWMTRFISIATCMILIGLAEWKTLKKPAVIAICVLLAIDSLPSLKHISGELAALTPQEHFEATQEFALLDKAQAATTQRLALLQEGGNIVDVYPVSDYGTPTNTTFGAGWEAANTSKNIVQLNKAASQGQYLYLFDRCIELGNDSVLVRTDAIKRLAEHPIEEMDAIAELCGYKLASSNDYYRLYHLDAPKSWGVKTTYRCLAIGAAAPEIALGFPAFEEAGSEKLDDYSFEELSKYELIYLDGFSYENRAYAEELIAALSDAGVKIIIIADGIPENRRSHDKSFLGVVCSEIIFSNGYPELETAEGSFFPALFPREHRSLNTYYVNGLDKVWGSTYDNDISLPFYGTVRNDNIIVIGLRLPYYYNLTQDGRVGALLSRAMNVSPNELPERRIVPLELEYGYNSFTVRSPEDDVNTTLAYHDSFESSAPISSKQNLTHVNTGQTEVVLKYPYPVAGAIVSVAGLALLVLYCIDIKKRSGK